MIIFVWYEDNFLNSIYIDNWKDFLNKWVMFN